jgi:hypothetical protein
VRWAAIPVRYPPSQAKLCFARAGISSISGLIFSIVHHSPFASEIIGRRDGRNNPARSISVQTPNIQAGFAQLYAPKFRQAGGRFTTSAMISEVLFGYFLFEEKVTDATALYQVASHSPELPIFSFCTLHDPSSSLQSANRFQLHSNQPPPYFVSQ